MNHDHMSHKIQFTINGEQVEINVKSRDTLLDVIRNDLKLTGTKQGCGMGECGACTVLMDGLPVYSCLVLAVEAEGRDIVTVEGLMNGEELHPLQNAFREHGAVQCGFCTPGLLLAAKALLDENPQPKEEEVRMAISGNICRCTGYVKIVDAILASGKAMSKAG